MRYWNPLFELNTSSPFLKQQLSLLVKLNPKVDKWIAKMWDWTSFGIKNENTHTASTTKSPWAKQMAFKIEACVWWVKEGQIPS